MRAARVCFQCKASYTKPEKRFAIACSSSCITCMVLYTWLPSSEVLYTWLPSSEETMLQKQTILPFSYIGLQPLSIHKFFVPSRASGIQN